MATGRERDGSGSTAGKTTVRELLPELETDDGAELLGQVIAYYHRELLANRSALDWLEARGLGSPELVEHFQLGLANRTLGLRLPSKNRKKGAEVRERLQRLGVLRPSGHEHLAGCVVVPFVDAEGRVVQACGRRMDGRPGRGTQVDLWLTGDRRGLLGRDAFEADEVVVVFCPFDALALWARGHRNVIAANGLDAPVEELCAAAKDNRTARVVLVVPRSAEADRTAARAGAALGGLGATVTCALLPEGMDVTRFLRSASDSAAAASELLRRAEPLAASEGAPERAAQPANDHHRPSAPQNPDELVLCFSDRRWRARGLSANHARGLLRVNLLVAREDVGFHVDVLDLCTARQRAAFVRMASEELCVDERVVKKDLGKVLLALEDAQDEMLSRAHEPTQKVADMTEKERAAAMALLRDPGLLDRVLADLERLGVVGEEENLLLAYLTAVSRKLAEPLAVVVQSSSAAGKSSVMQAVLALVPDEDKVVYSAMTGQSLYYMGSTDLRHKVLCVAEQHGADKASYALKLLQSEGALTIASTGKDPGSGRLVSQQYRVEGPVAIMLTTTSVDLDEELLSRCLVLAVDESPEQTRRIHARQRRAQTRAGLCAEQQRAEVLRLHQNAQRLLRPLRVLNPHLDALTYTDLRVRARRDHRKLLGLVEVIAVLHQHQREVRGLEDSGAGVEVVEVLPADMELARRLMAHVGVGGNDLPPQTLRLLTLLGEHAREQASELGIHRDHVRLSRRQVRERYGLGDTQLKTHLRRLVDAELVLAHRAPHGRGVVYSLAFDGGAEATSTCHAERSGTGRGKVGPWSGEGRASVGRGVPGESGVDSRACERKTPSPAAERTSQGTESKLGCDVAEDRGAE